MRVTAPATGCGIAHADAERGLLVADLEVAPREEARRAPGTATAPAGRRARRPRVGGSRPTPRPTVAARPRAPALPGHASQAIARTVNRTTWSRRGSLAAALILADLADGTVVALSPRRHRDHRDRCPTSRSGRTSAASVSSCATAAGPWASSSTPRPPGAGCRAPTSTGSSAGRTPWASCGRRWPTSWRPRPRPAASALRRRSRRRPRHRRRLHQGPARAPGPLPRRRLERPAAARAGGGSAGRSRCWSSTTPRPTTATRELVAASTGVRYVREPAAGLDFARNRALAEADGRGPGVRRRRRGGRRRATSPGCARRGPPTPTPAASPGSCCPTSWLGGRRCAFEQRGGFRRGFHRIRWQGDRLAGNPLYPFGAGMFGAGCNMSFRRGAAGRAGRVRRGARHRAPAARRGRHRHVLPGACGRGGRWSTTRARSSATSTAASTTACGASTTRGAPGSWRSWPSGTGGCRRMTGARSGAWCLVVPQVPAGLLARGGWAAAA